MLPVEMPQVSSSAASILKVIRRVKAKSKENGDLPSKIGKNRRSGTKRTEKAQPTGLKKPYVREM
jgi:hypothetical protein